MWNVSYKKYSLGVFLLVLRDLRFVGRHVELRLSFTTDDGEALLGRRLVASPVQPSVLILGFDVEDVLQIQLERRVLPGADHPGTLVHLEATSTCFNQQTR